MKIKLTEQETIQKIVDIYVEQIRPLLQKAKTDSIFWESECPDCGELTLFAIEIKDGKRGAHHVH